MDDKINRIAMDYVKKVANSNNPTSSEYRTSASILLTLSEDLLNKELEEERIKAKSE